ncbi:MAG: c-type cytochrome [Bdellovibrio bacteriovorus]
MGLQPSLGLILAMLPLALILPLSLAAALVGCAAADPFPPGDAALATPMGPGPPWGRGMGPPWAGPGRGMGMGRGMAMQRHRLAMSGGMPERYRGLRNPLDPTVKNFAAGETLYLSHCASCHGDQGQGDGPAAASLRPPPANLSWVARRPMASDGYLMWAVTEGGGALGSAMPAFGEALSETERWKILLFLRTL